jgi:hypothetical protein
MKFQSNSYLANLNLKIDYVDKDNINNKPIKLSLKLEQNVIRSKLNNGDVVDEIVDIKHIKVSPKKLLYVEKIVDIKQEDKPLNFSPKKSPILGLIERKFSNDEGLFIL